MRKRKSIRGYLRHGSKSADVDAQIGNLLVSYGLCLLDENDSGDDEDEQCDGQRAYTGRSHLL